MSALQYYVYYKIDPSRVEQLRALVEALFHEVAATTGVHGQWQRRRYDPSTFMEVYADVPAESGFAAALEAALHKIDFARTVPGRVTEVFQCA